MDTVELELYGGEVGHHDPGTQLSEHCREPARPGTDLQHPLPGLNQAGQEAPVNLEADATGQIASEPGPFFVTYVVVVVANPCPVFQLHGPHDGRRVCAATGGPGSRAGSLEPDVDSCLLQERIDE